ENNIINPASVVHLFERDQKTVDSLSYFLLTIERRNVPAFCNNAMNRCATFVLLCDLSDNINKLTRFSLITSIPGSAGRRQISPGKRIEDHDRFLHCFKVNLTVCPVR